MKKRGKVLLKTFEKALRTPLTRMGHFNRRDVVGGPDSSMRNRYRGAFGAPPIDRDGGEGEINSDYT